MYHAPFALCMDFNLHKSGPWRWEFVDKQTDNQAGSCVQVQVLYGGIVCTGEGVIGPSLL